MTAVSSSRKSVGSLVATGRVVPASAPSAGPRWASAASPEREASGTPGPQRVATPSLRAERRMEQLKAERGKEEVVQRLHGWESSKKARIEEAQQAAAPTFVSPQAIIGQLLVVIHSSIPTGCLWLQTPQAYAATRRSEYYEHEHEQYLLRATNLSFRDLKLPLIMDLCMTYFVSRSRYSDSGKLVDRC